MGRAKARMSDEFNPDKGLRQATYNAKKMTEELISLEKSGIPRPWKFKIELYDGTIKSFKAL